MTLPGATVTTQDGEAQAGSASTLATVYLIGELERGPLVPTRIRSGSQLRSLFGARTVDTLSMHDHVDAHVGEGGSIVKVVRLLGPAAAYADLDLSDGTTVAISYTALDKGAYGNRLAVDIDVSGSTFVVKEYLDGVLKSTSPALADGPAAAVWSLTSKYGRITDGPGGDPVATATPQALTGGDDDLDGITTTEIAAAAASIPAEGNRTGSITLPGRTAPASYLAIAPTARDRNWLVRPAMPPVEDVETLVDAAAEYRESDYADIIDPLAPNLTVPGLTPGTTCTVSPATVRCGAEARNDAAGISPNQPAAGEWGIAQYATAPTITWSDEDLATLNAAGINVVRVVDGKLKVYGSRTAADPDVAPVALRVGSARLRMSIVEIARSNTQLAAFAEVDRGGVVLGELAGKITGRINTYHQSLYYLNVTAELGDEEVAPGEYILDVAIEFQAAPDAERVRTVVSRQVTEV